MINGLRDAGRIRDVNLAVATFNILGMVLHFARWYREDGALDHIQIADEMVDLALSGLLRDSSNPAG